MTGFWLISYVVLWLLVLGEGLVILVLAREIESLHKRLEAAGRPWNKSEAGTGEARPGSPDLLPADGRWRSEETDQAPAADDGRP